MENTSLDKAQTIINSLRKHVGFEGWWIGQHPDFQNKMIEDMAVMIEGAPAEAKISDDMAGVVGGPLEGADGA